MDVINISDSIKQCITELDYHRARLEKAAMCKARSIVEYEKKLACKIIELKSNNTPISIVKDIAKGDCFNEKLELEKYEAGYKALITNIEAIQAKLNGYQSIFRHLDKG